MSKIDILIVDDNPEDRELYKRYITKDQPYSALEAEVGSEAMEILDQNTVDLILVDYNLPDMDGIEIIREIRKHERGGYLPIIMLTGLGNEQIAVDALKLGASDYLIKGKLSREALLRSIENALRQTKLEQELRDKTRELEDFVHVTAHDLKSPLSTIYVYCQMLKEQIAGDEDAQELVEVIEKRSEQMVNLIDTLLSYTRLGRVACTLKALDMNDILESVKENLHKQILDSQAQIIHQTLPLVLAEETGLMQIFQNIISNAMKYCRQQPLIEISYRSRDGRHIIAIKDNGIGIDTEHHKKIFQPFTRLHKSSSEFLGTGIGLANVQKIVEQFEGKIWLESTPGQGSTFYVSLSAGEDSPGEDAAQADFA